MTGQYVAHEQLSLLAMTVQDLENEANYCAFHISHPKKSFTVIAESHMMKIQWIRDINQAIINCKKRETASRDGPINRRMSMYGRIEEQQSRLIIERETSLRTAIQSDRTRQRRTSLRIQNNEPLLESEEDFYDINGNNNLSNVPFSATNTPTNQQKGLTDNNNNNKTSSTTSNDFEDFDEVIERKQLISNALLGSDNTEDNEDNNNNKGTTNNSSNLTPVTSSQNLAGNHEERLQKQLEKLQTFQQCLQGLSEKSLMQLYMAVSHHYMMLYYCILYAHMKYYYYYYIRDRTSGKV
jgi:hypothetical protein